MAVDLMSQSSNDSKLSIHDQYRKFLGTLRKYVSLAIPVTDAYNKNSLRAFSIDIKKHPKYIAIINGALLDTDVGIKFERIAMKNHVSFVTRDENIYSNPKLSFGIIYANKNTAINQNPIMWYSKYKQPSNVITFKRNFSSPVKYSLWNKLKNIFS